MSAALIWIVVGLGLLIVELFTMTFFLMWVAIAAFLAAAAVFIYPAAWVPWVVFCTSAVVLLLATRPLARSIHGRATVASNVDALIGASGVVLQPVDNEQNTGRVRVGSDEWRARSCGVMIGASEYVRVLAVEGTTLIVQPDEAPECCPQS